MLLFGSIELIPYKGVTSARPSHSDGQQAISRITEAGPQYNKSTIINHYNG